MNITRQEVVFSRHALQRYQQRVSDKDLSKVRKELQRLEPIWTVHSDKPSWTWLKGQPGDKYLYLGEYETATICFVLTPAEKGNKPWVATTCLTRESDDIIAAQRFGNTEHSIKKTAVNKPIKTKVRKPAPIDDVDTNWDKLLQMRSQRGQQ